MQHGSTPSPDAIIRLVPNGVCPHPKYTHRTSVMAYSYPLPPCSDKRRRLYLPNLTKRNWHPSWYACSTETWHICTVEVQKRTCAWSANLTKLRGKAVTSLDNPITPEPHIHTYCNPLFYIHILFAQGRIEGVSWQTHKMSPSSWDSYLSIFLAFVVHCAEHIRNPLVTHFCHYIP